MLHQQGRLTRYKNHCNFDAESESSLTHLETVLCELTQTESDRSLLPTAQQQYGQPGFGELPFFCFFLKIFGLNFCKHRPRVSGNVATVHSEKHTKGWISALPPP